MGFLRRPQNLKKSLSVHLTRASCSVRVAAYLSKSRRRFLKTNVDKSYFTNFNNQRFCWAIASLVWKNSKIVCQIVVCISGLFYLDEILQRRLLHHISQIDLFLWTAERNSRSKNNLRIFLEKTENVTLVFKVRELFYPLKYG